MKGCRQRRHRGKFPQCFHLHLRHKNTGMKCEDKGCTRKHSGSELSGQKSAELRDARHARLPVQGKSHTVVNARRIKMPRKTPAEQLQRNSFSGGGETWNWWRSGHTTVGPEFECPNPRRSKTTSVTDNENLAKRMDEDNFQRGPATSHQLEPVDEENMSKKARVARNVLHILGDEGVKFDVNEEAWPNADLVFRASYEGALIDGLPAHKVKAGDEREIQQMKDLQLYSWVKETDIPPNKSILLTGWARRLKGSEVRSRCVLKDFATTVRDDVFAPTPSPLSVRGLLLYAAWFDLRVETGDLVCAFMQADSPTSERARTRWMDLETAWSDERHANSEPRLHRIPGWNTHGAHGFQTRQTGAMSVLCMSRTKHVCIP